MFSKLLIANRGEIALRILRTCKEMGIATVAVHSEADERAMHVRFADESVCIGAAPSSASYLNIPSILAAAQLTSADAIHPGIGFMAENAKFAEITEEHGFIFVGPDAKHILMMGDKIRAKEFVGNLGVPTIPGSQVLKTKAEALETAAAIGYPLMLKAAGGGGGRGIRILTDEAVLREVWEIAGQEAAKNFGDATLYLEKYLSKPRHIEVQILGDKYAAAVHLGVRDCSLQRQHQKLVEEAPGPPLPKRIINNIYAASLKIVSALGYHNAGTIEFLYEDSGQGGEVYFMEMNTRLQVEHPVTEMVTGVDLVKQQLRIAAGGRLPFSQESVKFNGHAIECRINAENPQTQAPGGGKLIAYHTPGGLGVRVDSALYEGYEVPPWYDSLVAKLIIHAEDRPTCLKRLKWALDEFVIDGISSNLRLYRRLLREDDFIKGRYNINWFSDFARRL